MNSTDAATINIQLNGRSFLVPGGTTILDAAESAGIKIPTLCHDPRLSPSASCWICVVEVRGARGLVPACSTRAAEGMVITTDSPDIRQARKLCLELLLSDHRGDCVAPCQEACPARIDIQGYIALISRGDMAGALKLIKEKNPLPSICGRVCPRFCEKECRRNLVDEPVSINYLKRYAADRIRQNGAGYVPRPAQPSHKKVAIVGGGPAGLSAAYYLRVMGHEVTLIEGTGRLGGMLLWGIPEYRLPKAVMDEEIAEITGLGMEVRYNEVLGKDFSIDDLLLQGYDSVLVAIGAQLSRRMGCEGEDLPGVLSGLAFLANVAAGRKVETGKRVIVVGGGNTAIDSARTALRLGAGRVMIVYRRSRDEMPANPEEIGEAEKEGVEFFFLAAPAGILESGGKITGLEVTRMRLGEPDRSGRRRPEPVPGSNETIRADTIISAIGQYPDLGWTSEEGLSVRADRHGNISVDPVTTQTDIPGVFAAGDAVSGAATVIEAIAAGRKAALNIDSFLRGLKPETIIGKFNASCGKTSELDPVDFEEHPRLPRNQMPCLDSSERSGNFRETELGFTEEMAMSESDRCLSCGCSDAFDCKLREYATDYAADPVSLTGEKRNYTLDGTHPFILLDSNKCITCGSCVKICSDVQAVGAYGFIRRGFETRVAPYMEGSLLESGCESCGQCLTVCPTGAISANSAKKSGPWTLERTFAVCPHCSVGCSLQLESRDGFFAGIRPYGEDPVSSGNLCHKGRFGADFSGNGSLKRLLSAHVRSGGKLIPSVWEETISFAAARIREIRDRWGPDSIGILASPRYSNEELYLIQKTARAAVGTNNIGSLSCFTARSPLAECFGVDASPADFSELDLSDLFLIADPRSLEHNPVLGLRVISAARRGSRIILLGDGESKYEALADDCLRLSPALIEVLLKGLAECILEEGLFDSSFISERTGDFELFRESFSGLSLEEITLRTGLEENRMRKLARLLAGAGNPVFLTNSDLAGQAVTSLLLDISLLLGHPEGLIILRDACNSQGLADMGISPIRLPGQDPFNSLEARNRLENLWKVKLPQGRGMSPQRMLASISEGGLRALLIFGEDPVGAGIREEALRELDFLLVHELFLTRTAELAQVVLPAAAFSETRGSYTNSERRVKISFGGISPPHGKENYDAIADLGNALGHTSSYDFWEEILAEIRKAVPVYHGAEPAVIWRKGLKLDLPEGRARFIPYDRITGDSLQSLTARSNSYRFLLKKQVEEVLNEARERPT
jgi:formate dehydrogenase major subunit